MTLHELAQSPEAYRHTVTSDGSWSPTTDVVSAVLLVRRADRVEAQWSVTTHGTPTATEIVFEHLFSASDLPRGSAGRIVIRPKITLTSGVIYADAVSLVVKGVYEP